MNGRIESEETPEARIAAVVRSLAMKMEKRYQRTGVGPKQPDYADYRDALKPFLEKELLQARIDEARKTSSAALTNRMRELSSQLLACEKAILEADLR